MISYKPLYETMKQKNIKQCKLINDIQISTSVFDRIRKNKYISLEIIERMCHALDCKVNDIVRIL